MTFLLQFLISAPNHLIVYKSEESVGASPEQGNDRNITAANFKISTSADVMVYV